MKNTSSGPYTDLNNNEMIAYIYFPPAGESMKPVRVFSVVPRTENHIYLWCAEKESDAQNGWGDVKEKARLQPYTEKLWEERARFIEYREKTNDGIKTAYNQLAHFGQQTKIGHQALLFEPYEIAMSALQEIVSMANPPMYSYAERIAMNALKLIGVM